MTVPFKKKRRDLLRFAVALGGFGFSSLGWSKKVQSRDENLIDPVAIKLSCFFSKKESASAIGSKYLKGAPQEADINVLVGRLCRHQAGVYRKILNADKVTVRKIILNQQREDFGQGRTLRVDGWILSETETRLCALSVLMARYSS